MLGRPGKDSAKLVGSGFLDIVSLSLILLIGTLPDGDFARYIASSGAKTSYAGQDVACGVGVIASEESTSPVSSIP